MENSRKIKILCVTGSFKFGGGQRQLTNILKLLDRERFEVAVCTFRKEGAYLSEVPSDVCIYELATRNHRGNLLPHVWQLRDLIQREKPDVLYSHLAGSNVKLGLAHMTLRRSSHPNLIVSVANNPQHYSRRRRHLMKMLYPRATAICPVSAGMKDALILAGYPKEKMHFIPNAVDTAYVRKLADQPLDHPWLKTGNPILVSVSRLVPQKAYQNLLLSFRQIAESVPSYLWIIGDGPERGKLESLSQELKLEEHVEFLGFQPNPFKYMARADLFVLSSLWEGLASVLVEAGALGLPIVASRAPYGTEEVVQDGENGFLVPVQDIDGISERVIFLLQNDDIRVRCAEASRRIVEERFSAEVVVRQFEALFCKHAKDL